MDPQQPLVLPALSPDFLAWMADVAASSQDTSTGGAQQPAPHAQPAPQAAPQPQPGAPVGVNLPAGAPPAVSNTAQSGSVPPAVASQPAPAPPPSAAQTYPVSQPMHRGQQHRAPLPGGSRPHPPPQASHHTTRAPPPQPVPQPPHHVQQPLLRPPIVPSQAAWAAQRGMVPPGIYLDLVYRPQALQMRAQALRQAMQAQAIRAQALRVQAIRAHALQAQAQMYQRQTRYAPPPGPPHGWTAPAPQRYAPPPGPPPGWTAPAPTPQRYAPPPGPPPGWTGFPLPQRAQPIQFQTHLASPSNTASAVFTPLPAVSTPATTPRFALTPSPAVGGTAPLPQPRAPQGARKTPLAAQHEATGRRGVALERPVARSSKKRQRSDEGETESGPSKRAATQIAVQARATDSGAIGRQVHSHNNNIPTQRAPAIPQRDASPAPEAAAPAASTEEVAGEQVNGGTPAEAEDDEGSLFGGDDTNEDATAVTQPILPAALPEPDATAKAPTPPPPATPAFQLWLPGMDPPAPVPAADRPILALPGTDPLPEGGISSTYRIDYMRGLGVARAPALAVAPTPAPAAPAFSPAPAPAAPAGASKRKGKQPAGAARGKKGATSSAPEVPPAQPPTAAADKKPKQPRKKKNAAGSSAGSGASTAASTTPAKKPKKKEDAVAPGTSNPAVQQFMREHGMYKKHPWMLAEAGSSSAGPGPSTMPAPPPGQ